MDAELKALEDKVSQLVTLCRRLRTENGLLRQQSAALQNEKRRLEEKMSGAQARLERLLEEIPEENE